MLSVSMQTAYERLEEASDDLWSTHRGLGNIVVVILDDGTNLTYADAFTVKLDDHFLGVLTEHYGTHVFAVEDLEFWGTYKRVNDVVL